MPKDVSWRGKTVFTGIWKHPVDGPVMVRRLNIDGDGQGDRHGHGGEQRAVLVYQIQSYRHWQRYLGRDDFGYGQFGENLTVDGQPVDGQVLPELAVTEVIPAQVPLPVPVGLDLVDQHRPLLPAVAVPVALPVAVDVEPPDHHRAVHRVLPYAGEDGLAPPRNVLGHPHVHRQQGRHGLLLSAAMLGLPPYN